MPAFPRWLLVLVVILLATGCAPASLELSSITAEMDYGVDDPQFQRTMGHLLGPALRDGNSVQTLVNGEEIFPAMLEAIGSAQRTITFETYVYWSGAVGETFALALAARAAAGVKVHVIIDAIGGDSIDRDYIEQMEDAGVEVLLYRPLPWYDVTKTGKLNNRTHRKILVVDGRVGFTGGVGIGDEWLGDARSPEEWRDTHYRVEGPVVANLQAAFVDNWIEATGEVLHGDAYFPALEDAGSMRAQAFMSSPEGGSRSMQLMYLLSFAAARQRILLGTAYFIPDDLTIDALVAARRRGVAVQVLVPGRHIDFPLARDASRARWGELLEAGVEIYEYEPTMYHVKLMVVDDRWVSIGSANLSNRSFRLNDEANLSVLDVDFAAEQARLFEADLARAKRVAHEQWKARPLGERLGEFVGSLLAPLI